MPAGWLKNAVFYEVYPQSFYDSNGDGIGDLRGIQEKLSYIASLGCTALWINPCFDSPFKDGGYDVRDYRRIAPRYGSNEDMCRLLQAAHEKGLRVLLDLVPGHTSEEHSWFLESARAEKNKFSDRYIWTDDPSADGDGMPFIGGEYPRAATYIVNFFKCQPALNYGYWVKRMPWQQGLREPEPLATREAMKDIMRFWLDMGCDGFRVDMADSLVKNDDGEKSGTREVWRDLTDMVHREYPEAVLVSEWCRPRLALSCGFDMDFFLSKPGNGYASLVRDYSRGEKRADNSYFKADSNRDVSRFLEDYLPQYEASREDGLWCFLTGNHDTLRLAPSLTERERRLAFAFLFTMPGAPFLYYGDEIGMRYREIPTKEGGYHRTGSRTPMQWSRGRNRGFSEAEKEMLYLPVEEGEDAPCVEEQERDPDSFLHFVRSLTTLRHGEPELQSYSPFAVYRAEKGSRLFAYRRGSLLAAVNPGRETLFLLLDGAYRVIYRIGEPKTRGNQLSMPEQSFAVLKRV